MRGGGAGLENGVHAGCDGWHGAVGGSDGGVIEGEGVDEFAEEFALGDKLPDGEVEESCELRVGLVHGGIVSGW